PPMPAQAANRNALTDYLAHRLRYFFGPYLNRANYLPASNAEFEGMRSALSQWRFWNAFGTAIRRLRDSHTMTFTLANYVIDNTRPLNACFVVGNANVSHDVVPAHAELADVLVSHAGATHAWGLSAGDRLVAIDGEHPIAWMRKLIAHDFGANPANDPISLSWMTERVRGSIPRYARDLTVVRCPAGVCAAPETIEVSSIPEEPDPSSVNAVACDGRPQPLVASQPASHSMGFSAYAGPVLGSLPEEKIYGLVWDYLIMGTPGETQVANAVKRWRADGRGVILDHRLGNGGSGAQGGTSIADPILAFVRPPALFGVMPWRHTADEQGPTTPEQGLDLVAKYANTAYRWGGGGNDARIDVPVALLITSDVSYSDLFPYAFRGAPKVRIFGPHPTNGAFSTFVGLSYWRGFNYQLASGDTIGADGQALCGRGVAPNEVVLPLQSDLLAGKDTLIERALSWVRAGAQP
ncbi:MAG: hypothetical protein MUF54_13970, partial [Polyangiaceae bacterium]|nr:hypothetical protein [Polyangiaceae bacterium]